MAKKVKSESEELAVVDEKVVDEKVGGALAPAPEFMLEDAGVGTEDLGQYIVPPRLKIVQKMSGDEFEAFKVGTVIAVPHLMEVAGMVDKKNGVPFHFVPLFFFVEWCTWNPYQMKDTLPTIRERTLDKDHKLVAKCKNSKLWSEKCPENPKYEIRHVEHLNFVIALQGDHELSGVPMILSFGRSHHRQGTNFAALLKMRNSAPFGCVFTGTVGFKSNNMGDWFAIDVSNPTAESGLTPWVDDKEIYERLKKFHFEMKEAHSSRLIQVDYDDVPSEPNDAKGEF